MVQTKYIREIKFTLARYIRENLDECLPLVTSKSSSSSHLLCLKKGDTREEKLTSLEAHCKIIESPSSLWGTDDHFKLLLKVFGRSGHIFSEESQLIVNSEGNLSPKYSGMFNSEFTGDPVCLYLKDDHYLCLDPLVQS